MNTSNNALNKVTVNQSAGMLHSAADSIMGTGSQMRSLTAVQCEPLSPAAWKPILPPAKPFMSRVEVESSQRHTEQYPFTTYRPSANNQTRDRKPISPGA